MAKRKRFSDKTIIKDEEKTVPPTLIEKLGVKDNKAQTNRKNKKGIMVYVTSEDKKKLKLIALDQEKTQTELMEEALKIVFQKYS